MMNDECGMISDEFLFHPYQRSCQQRANPVGAKVNPTLTSVSKLKPTTG